MYQFDLAGSNQIHVRYKTHTDDIRYRSLIHGTPRLAT